MKFIRVYILIKPLSASLVYFVVFFKKLYFISYCIYLYHSDQIDKHFTCCILHFVPANKIEEIKR